MPIHKIRSQETYSDVNIIYFYNKTPYVFMFLLNIFPTRNKMKKIQYELYNFLNFEHLSLLQNCLF